MPCSSATSCSGKERPAPGAGTGGQEVGWSTPSKQTDIPASEHPNHLQAAADSDIGGGKQPSAAAGTPSMAGHAPARTRVILVRQGAPVARPLAVAIVPAVWRSRGDARQLHSKGCGDSVTVCPLAVRAVPSSARCRACEPSALEAGQGATCCRGRACSVVKPCRNAPWCAATAVQPTLLPCRCSTAAAAAMQLSQKGCVKLWGPLPVDHRENDEQIVNGQARDGHQHAALQHGWQGPAPVCGEPSHGTPISSDHQHVAVAWL